MRKKFYIAQRCHFNDGQKFRVVNKSFNKTSKMFYEKKEELTEKYPILEKKTIKEIFRWAFRTKGQSVYMFNMNQFRLVWNFNFPSDQLSKGKVGALSEGEISFILREYVRVGSLDPKTNIEDVIDKTIKMSYKTREILNAWINTQ